MLPGIQYIRPLVDHAISAALCRCDDLRRPVCTCGDPSLCDTCDDTAYGQDANWVRINFARLQALDPALTNAEQVLSIGYSNWVAGVVSANAPNGLFCLNVTFVEAPAEITRLSVGAQVVAVAAAGEYSFLLPKGERHEIEMSYVNEDISFSYFDAFTGRSVSRSRLLSLQNLSFTNIHTEITASSMSDEVELVVSSPNTPTGYITWNPSLSITPDHCFDPTYPILFCAFVDLPLDAYPSVRWTSDDGSVSSTGEWMLFDGDASLARDITVTASYGGVELTGYISIRQIVSETRIALATPSVIVVEDPYTNSPNEVVVRTSNTVKMSASWELAQSGRLLLESSDAASTRVCVGPDMDEVPSFPYEIGTFKQNESGTCDFYLASTNMNVTGVGGTYTLRFVPDEGVELESTTNVKIAKVRVMEYQP